MSIIIDFIAKVSNDNSGSMKFLHKTVSNWYDVLFLIMGFRNSIEVKLRNGKSYKIELKEDFATLDYRDKQVKFCYDTQEEKIHVVLMLIGEFIDQPHKSLDVHNRDVVDIGAYIGDTPIYFALSGAKHVYGFEPYPYSFNIAKRNVAKNKLESKITMLNMGCGSKNDKIKIESSYKNLAGSDLKDSKSGKSINIISLEKIVQMYDIQKGALKVDCEGCEYDIILKSKVETLRSFSKILIEYHYGYKDLEKRLVGAGFKVSHTKPEKMENANAEKHQMYGGSIFAELKNSVSK